MDIIKIIGWLRNNGISCKRSGTMWSISCISYSYITEEEIVYWYKHGKLQKLIQPKEGNMDNKIKFMEGDQQTNCGNCEHSDSGVCEFAGEVGSKWVCNRYEKRED